MRNKRIKRNSFLMEIPHFGNLYMYEVLDNFIYPRIFIATNDADEKILMYEMVNGYKDKEQDLWLAVSIGEEVYNRLMKGLISIQNAFLDRIFRFCIIYDYTEEVGSILDDTEDFIDKLPVKPLYVKKDDTGVYSVE